MATTLEDDVNKTFEHLKRPGDGDKLIALMAENKIPECFAPTKALMIAMAKMIVELRGGVGRQ